MSRSTVLAVTWAFCLGGMLTAGAAASDWSRFRGPNGSGVSPDKAATPVTWSETENVKWKIDLPGPGVSCPIVVGDRVFVTCYSGYGVSRGNVGNQKNLKRHLVCVDRKSGKLLWEKSVDAVLPEDPFSGAGVPEHGYASHTPVSDGEHVYVYFGKTGALAFDMDGKQLWQTNLGKESDPRRWGSSSSPILYKHLLIVTASAESEALVALDTKTGKEVWRQEASGFANVWGTPVLAPIDENKSELVIGVPNEIWGFDPETGKLRWYCEVMSTDQFQSSVVAGPAGKVYAVEGRGGGSIAVRPGGKGDVTKSHIEWNGRDSSRFGTPVVYDGRIYYFSGAVANCIDAKTGKRVFQSRMQSGPAVASNQPAPQRGGNTPGRFGGGNRFGGGGRFGGGMGGASDYASPVIADGKIYITRRSGDVYVLEAGDKFKQLAVNRVTDEREDFSATPAVSDGELFFRSSKRLYCVGLAEKK